MEQPNSLLIELIAGFFSAAAALVLFSIAAITIKVIIT